MEAINQKAVQLLAGVVWMDTGAQKAAASRYLQRVPLARMLQETLRMKRIAWIASQATSVLAVSREVQHVGQGVSPQYHDGHSMASGVASHVTEAAFRMRRLRLSVSRASVGHFAQRERRHRCHVKREATRQQVTLRQLRNARLRNLVSTHQQVVSSKSCARQVQSPQTSTQGPVPGVLLASTKEQRARYRASHARAASTARRARRRHCRALVERT